MKNEQEQKPPGILSVIGSVLSAMIGIQSDENRERDFDKGHAGNYLFVGIIAVAIFVFVLIAIVNHILDKS